MVYQNENCLTYLWMTMSLSCMILRNSSISLLICLERRWVLDVLLLTMSTNEGLLRRLALVWPLWGKEPANRRPPDNDTAILAIWCHHHIPNTTASHNQQQTNQQQTTNNNISFQLVYQFHFHSGASWFMTDKVSAIDYQLAWIEWVSRFFFYYFFNDRYNDVGHHFPAVHWHSKLNIQHHVASNTYNFFPNPFFPSFLSISQRLLRFFHCRIS